MFTNNMRIYLTLLYVICICSMFFTGCSKSDDNAKNEPVNNNEQNGDNNNANNTEQDNRSYIKEDDLHGVWAVSGNGSDKYFIYFTPTGKYSFCFNSTQMGGGVFQLDKNKLTLNNAYLNTKDVLDLEQDGLYIKIKGEIHKFKSNAKEPVNISIYKTDSEIPTTKTGEVFKIWGLHVTYGNVITYIKYETDYMIKYQYCKDNSLKQVISESNWFYVYNNGMTYTQDCSGNGNVTIYKLQDHYQTLNSQIVPQ